MVKTESMKEYVARRIRELRDDYGKSGLSQEALAKMVGVATNTISRWETGTYEPTLDDLEKLSRMLGVAILEFFPKVERADQKSKTVDALLRTARGLNKEDLDELRRYAEFRRARNFHKTRAAARQST
jgi:transcriptional regulator with XRE-family HTH domain